MGLVGENVQQIVENTVSISAETTVTNVTEATGEHPIYLRRMYEELQERQTFKG